MTGYEPFSYLITDNGSVLVCRAGRVVTTVRGAAAATLVAKLGRGTDSDQRLLQRVTGNYKRGNER